MVSFAYDAGEYINMEKSPLFTLAEKIATFERNSDESVIVIYMNKEQSQTFANGEIPNLIHSVQKSHMDPTDPIAHILRAGFHSAQTNYHIRMLDKTLKDNASKNKSVSPPANKRRPGKASGKKP